MNGGFKEQYLKSELLSKYSDSSTTPAETRRSSAIQKWLGVESRNAKTNCRLLIGDEDFGWTTSDRLFALARTHISKVLGRLVPEVLFGGSHSNGASTRVGRSPTAQFEKHAGEAHVSSRALKHWFSVASETRLSEQVLSIQESSVLFTVPKSTDIDRVACKEPEINMYLQRTVGTYIRKRLKKFGIDLRDQTRNQLLAKNAVSLGLATIDLSSASDSISKQLVINLLPFEWFSLLDDLRAHSVDIDGTCHFPEMFSSMGNGFTFELESLIFWALTRSTCQISKVKGKISVYGDDIIAPSLIAPRLARLFHWVGFKVNPKKSHWTGQFRESCGKHYYGPQEVTPFYIREPVRSLTDVIRLLNRLLIWDSYSGFFITPEVANFHYQWALKIVPFKLWGGPDPEDITSLVTGHPLRRRLIRRRTALSLPGEAGLTTWLNNKEASIATLSFDPRVEKRHFIGNFSPWQCNTTWDPYLIFGPFLVHYP
jgi:hypothetical protein